MDLPDRIQYAALIDLLTTLLPGFDPMEVITIRLDHAEVSVEHLDHEHHGVATKMTRIPVARAARATPSAFAKPDTHAESGNGR